MQGNEHYQNQFRQFVSESFKKYIKKGSEPNTKVETLKDKSKMCFCRSNVGNLDLGGDADRVLNAHSYHRRNATAQLFPSLDDDFLASATRITDAIDSGHRNFLETESISGAVGNGSEGSVKSLKSAKTVVSRRSSHQLRQCVKSQCKLHETIDETLKQVGSSADVIGRSFDETNSKLNQQSTTEFPLDQCQHRSETMHPYVSSHKNVMTETGKEDFIEDSNTDTLTITVDDVVNSKVINPMIRKLQRMYLNNMKEEMSLMEDLERLPHQVNEVYKATIFKQKQTNGQK